MKKQRIHRRRLMGQTAGAGAGAGSAPPPLTTVTAFAEGGTRPRGPAPPRPRARGAPRGAPVLVRRAGPAAVGAAELSQLVASQGGSFVANPIVTQTVWRERGAMLLDKMGPAIIMTHSAGGPFGYLVAEVRPQLVKGIVVIEGAGAPF